MAERPLSGHLPPLNACRSFEAAARHASFARAAEDLHVTPAAVSHQVKQLEAWLGHRLFTRSHNGLALTERGRTLLAAVREGFAQIVKGIEAISSATISPALAISVAPNFAIRWLIPRLGAFAQDHPAVRIELVNRPQIPDFSRDRFDVAIRHLDMSVATGGERGDVCFDLLFPGDTTPVASPALIKAAGIRRPADLARCTLLHIAATPDDWSRWMAAAGVTGVDAHQGPSFDSYAMAVEAAASGWGVAMAREDFIVGDLEAGRLVVPFAARLPSSRAWFLISFADPPPHVAAFRAWLLGQARSSRAAVKPRRARPAPRRA